MIHPPHHLVILTMVLLLLLVCFVPVSAKECSNIDIRNSVQDMNVLRNCTVVHGFLQIVLMDNKNNDFTNVSFPELREITGFLMVFRIFGLIDLGPLFPNLTIIRGGTLFTDYSLIIYDLPDLQKVGLRNLLSIERGSVRIESCGKLCFASTIDWDQITANNVSNVIPKDSANCPNVTLGCRLCPWPGKCWSFANCQKKIGDSLAQHLFGDCHEQCLGKCLNKQASGCTVCKNVSYNGTCAEKCPPNTILNQHTNRCLTETQCIQAKRFVHKEDCVTECPPKFMVDPNHPGRCTLCPHRCPKFCPGTMIDFVSVAHELRGCTIITGNLLIKVSSDVQNVDSELESNLGDIEEIHGYLKIYRSISITSLNFLRSLKIIHGKSLESERYSFVLFDNQNLKRLFDFTVREPLEISRGGISIHYNYKLCQSEIESFKSKANIQNHPMNNLPLTNAASGHCDFHPIHGEYSRIFAHNVTIFWSEFAPQTSGVTVEGYILYYMETTRDNLNWYNGRESCSTYSWKMKTLDVDLQFDAEKKMYFTVLAGLKQVTKYAFYIRSFQSLLNSISGQSTVKYFTTLLDTLTPPLITTMSKEVTSITLNWRVPVKERESINFFHVDILKLKDMESEMDLRDYCKHPLIDDAVADEKQREQELNEKLEECNCDEDMDEDDFVNLQMDLYDNLRRLYFGSSTINCNEEPNHAICESYENKRFKRSLYEFQRKFVLPENHTIETRGITRAENYFKSFRIDRKLNNFTFPDLSPYTRYQFEFFSCHTNTECSTYFLHVDRTNPNLTADGLSKEAGLIVNYDDDKSVTLEFKQPQHPNGVTLGYRVEQMVIGYPAIITCITRLGHQENNYRFVVEDLQPNVYEFRVRSFSLALEGPWTEWERVVVKDRTPTPPVSALHFNFVGSLIVIFIVAFAISGGIYSYRNFKCLRRGDDTVYLMSDLERELNEDNKGDADFFPIAFSGTQSDSS